jgi:hypothetical protein
MSRIRYHVEIRWTVPISEIINAPEPPPEGWTPPEVDGAIIVEADVRQVIYQFVRTITSVDTQGEAADVMFDIAHWNMEKAKIGSQDDDVKFSVWRVG